MWKRLLFGFAVLVMTVHVAPVLRAEDSPKGQVVCPVLGEPIKDLETAPRSEYKGKTYYFCCPSCKKKFDKDPERYVGEGRPVGHEGCRCGDRSSSG